MYEIAYRFLSQLYILQMNEHNMFFFSSFNWIVHVRVCWGSVCKLSIQFIIEITLNVNLFVIRISPLKVY